MKKLLQGLILFSLFNTLEAQVSKYIVLEEFTTAPCGFCPDGDVIADELLEKHENLIVIAHHAGFGRDSMTIPESQELAAYTNSAPTAALNRRMYDDETIYLNASGMVWSRQRWDSVITADLLIPAPVEVILNHTYDETSRTVDATLEMIFNQDIDHTLLHVNFVVLEDSVIGIGPGYDQVNYLNGSPSHPMYQRGDPIIGYEHRHVARSMVGGTWGIPLLTNGPILKGEAYTFQTNFVLDPKWDESKISLVGWVNYYDPEDRAKHEILNAIHSQLNLPVVSINAYANNIDKLKVFPNPVTDYVNINLDSKNDLISNVFIFNQIGQRIFSSPNLLNEKSYLLNTKKFPHGSYTFKVNTMNGNEFAEMLIKN